MDDDTVCQFRAAPVARPGIALTSAYDPSEYWYFADDEEAFGMLDAVDRDFLGLHEQLLGKDVVDCLAECEGRWQQEETAVENIDAEFLTEMPDGRIALSFVGAVGDSGMSSREGRLFLEGDSYRRLVEHEDGYPANRDTRTLLRIPRRLSVSSGLFCMTMNTGMGGRSLLPPFVSRERNSDAVFSAVLKTCRRRGFRGFVPGVAITHNPPNSRRHETSEIAIPPLRQNNIIILLIGSFGDWPATRADETVRELGRYLAGLSNLSRDAFANRICQICRRNLGENIAQIQRLMGRRENAPEYWLNDVTRYLESAAEAVTRDEFFVPADLEGSADSRLQVFRDFIGRYGELLVHWPDIYDGARDMAFFEE